MIDGLMARLAKEIWALRCSARSLPRMTYDEAMERLRPRRPDLRFGMEI